MAYSGLLGSKHRKKKIVMALTAMTETVPTVTAIKTDSKKQAVPEFATGTDRYIKDYGCAVGGMCA